MKKKNKNNTSSNQKLKDNFTLSKHEFLNYIETNLWGKFQSRLWKIVTVALAVITFAGIFGVPYYIKNEVDKRLTEQQHQFSQEAQEVLNGIKLLNLVSLVDESKRFEFRTISLRLASAIGKVDSIDSSIPSHRIHYFMNSLSAAAYSGSIDISDVDNFKLIQQHKSFMQKEVLPPEVVFENYDKSVGKTSAYMPHPFNDGTVGGVIKDLMVRSAHLEVLRHVKSDIQNEVLAIGYVANSDIMKDRLLIEAGLRVKYQSKYDSLLQKSLIGYFSDSESNYYDSLYRIDFE